MTSEGSALTQLGEPSPPETGLLPTPQPPTCRRSSWFLTREEVDALAERIDPRYRTLIYTAAFTGLRASELYGLRVRDIGLKRSVLRVRQSFTLVDGSDRQDADPTFGDLKSPKSRRTVPLPQFLRAMFAQHLAALPGGVGPDALVFTGSTDAPIRHGLFVRRYFSPAVEALVADEELPPEKEGLTFHGLRHTYAALSSLAGDPIEVLARNMGHSSIKVTVDTYGHLYESIRERSADRLDALYEEGSAPAAAEATPENVVELRR